MLCCSAGTATELIDIGDLPGGVNPVATGVSNTGVVVGYSGTFWSMRAFRWQRGSGMSDLGTFPGGNQAQARAVSNDGTLVVGISTSSGENTAFLRNQHVMIPMIPEPGAEWSRGDAVASGPNVDGYAAAACTSWIAGNMRAYRWHTNGSRSTRIDLGVLPRGTMSYSTGISNDGNVIVGTADYWGFSRAFRWTHDLGLHELGTLPTGATSNATGVNATGEIVVGSADTNLGQRAFRWSASEGMINLGVPAGYTASNAVGVSGCGNVVIGHLNTVPSLWTPALGWVELATYLSSTLLVDVTNWTLLSVTAISDDGRSIVGTGTHNGVSASWLISGIVYVEVECLGDLTCDDFVDGADLAVLLGLWGVHGSPVVADLNLDGQVDGVDLAVLLGNWGPCQ
jgi:probable HAF family extracellular repeat protein